MKRFINSLTFIFKAFLLIIILLFGWAFVNISNLIKGKKLSGKDSLSKNMFGVDEAKADTLPNEGTACPFAAYFDGEKFQIENDFLCGKFSRYSRWFFPFKSLKPDLLKFYHAPQKCNGKLIFQLQENEAEESFISRLKFIRVAHPKNSEVVVDSSFEKFHVIESASMENLISAESVLINGAKDSSGRFNDPKKFFKSNCESDDLILNKNDHLEFVFSGLKSGAAPVLIVKSTFRDWNLGEAVEPKITSFAKIFYSPAALRIGLLFVTMICFVFGRKVFSNWPAFLPIVFGTQTKSIVFSYSGQSGNFIKAAINKPRAWNFSSETIALPKEAVMEDGTMRVKAEFTKRHKLAFAGVLQGAVKAPHRSEELCVKSAESSRLGDVARLLSEKNNKYLHLIPGDTVDIEVEDFKILLNKDEKETYLMQSFGYYSPLSSKYKKIIGDWMSKIPAEVKAYYEQVAKSK